MACSVTGRAVPGTVNVTFTFIIIKIIAKSSTPDFGLCGVALVLQYRNNPVATTLSQINDLLYRKIIVLLLRRRVVDLDYSSTIR